MGGMLFWICIILLVLAFGFAVFANIHVYTAYQLSATVAWREWEVWKNKLEEQGFEIELKEVEQSGCVTRFYYSVNKKPQK